MSDERYEKPKTFHITGGNIKINDIEIKDGDILSIIVDGLILKQGRIKFGFYVDNTWQHDYWHLGYYIIWANGKRQTLADALREIEIYGWKWRIENNENGE